MALFGFGNSPGAGGLTGFFNGPTAYGDSGTAGAVTPNGSGLSTAMSGNQGNALGIAPTGFFSGLLPGGGMTGAQGGAIGGGISGAANGAAPLGGATMGGNSPWPYALGAAGLAGLGYAASKGSNKQMGAPDQPPPQHFGFGNPAVKFAPPSSQLPYMQVSLR